MRLPTNHLIPRGPFAHTDQIREAAQQNGETWFDADVMKAKMQEIGLAKVNVYLACAAYWILVNSVLEEYVWRWFLVQESEKVMGAFAAIIFSAFGFSIHHLIAMQLYFNWTTVSIATP